MQHCDGGQSGTDAHGAPRNESFDLSKCGLDPRGHNLEKYYTIVVHSNIHKANTSELSFRMTQSIIIAITQHSNLDAGQHFCLLQSFLFDLQTTPSASRRFHVFAAVNAACKQTISCAEHTEHFAQ